MLTNRGDEMIPSVRDGDPVNMLAIVSQHYFHCCQGCSSGLLVELVVITGIVQAALFPSDLQPSSWSA